MEGFIITVVMLFLAWDEFIGKPARREKYLNDPERIRENEAQAAKARESQKQDDKEREARRQKDYEANKHGNETREEYSQRKSAEIRAKDFLEEVFANAKAKAKAEAEAKHEARVRQLELEGYTSYITNSPEWQEKREERFALDNHKCQSCGTSKQLQVHHIDYNTLFNEDMYSLVTVCKSCHKKIHETAGKNASYYPVFYGYES